MDREALLALARDGDLDALGARRAEVADAVASLARDGDAARALELAGRSWRIWFVCGELEQAESVVAAALAAPGASTVVPWRARVLYADGVLAFRSGDRDRSLARNEDVVALARESADVRGECDGLTGLARVALRDGRYDEVVALASQAREKAASAGDEEAGAAPLHLQAAGTRLLGDYARARELYLESLALNTSLANTAWISMEHHNLGWVELHLGDPDAAVSRFRSRDETAATDAYGDAWSHLNWAAVALARGERDEAKRRFDAGVGALDELGIALDPDDQSELTWLRERVAQALDPPRA